MAGIDLSRVALKRRRTKIVATVGPASSDPAILDQLIDSGVDVFRMNFSHGTHEAHGLAYAAIRAAAERSKRQVAILADLCGPKVRVGKFEGGFIDLPQDAMVIVTVRPGVTGKPGLIPSEYEPLARDLKPGARVLLDDGKLELKVEGIDGTEVSCRVVAGGKLKDRKGMNMPGAKLSAEAITEKDKADAAFAAKLGVDFVALSFVRAAQDVKDLRALLAASGAKTPIISKIEMPEALRVIEEIVDASDGVMVARGDLGVEMEPEEVPLIQQELIRLCIAKNRPVIVATQMLESMIETPRPTRAEVTDVAWACISRADAVMLSAETASGKYPVRSVQTMDRVLRMVEGYQFKHGQFTPAEHNAASEAPVQEAITHAATVLTAELKARAIVVPTRSGRTARLTSAERPSAPILALTHDPQQGRQLALLWGVWPMICSEVELVHPAKLALSAAKSTGLAEPGQPILLIWDSASAKLPTPTVTVLTVE